MAISRSRSSRRNRKLSGGSCSSCAGAPQQVMLGGAAYAGDSAWGSAVYGGPGQQHAGVGNLIAMNNVGSCGGANPVAVQQGGKRRKSKRRGGRKSRKSRR